MRKQTKETCEDCQHFKGCNKVQGEFTQMQEMREVNMNAAKTLKTRRVTEGFKQVLTTCGQFKPYPFLPEKEAAHFEYIKPSLSKWFPDENRVKKPEANR